MARENLAQKLEKETGRRPEVVAVNTLKNETEIRRFFRDLITLYKREGMGNARTAAFANINFVLLSWGERSAKKKMWRRALRAA